MKTDDIAKRIEEVSQKLGDKPENIVRFDPTSFSEPERLLASKVAEVWEEYQKTGDEMIVLKNFSLFGKVRQVVLRRITQLYTYSIPILMHGIIKVDDEILDYYFKLQYANFEADLMECFLKLETWTKEEQEDFLKHLKKNGGVIFRFPKNNETPESYPIKDTDEDKDEEEDDQPPDNQQAAMAGDEEEEKCSQ